MDRELLQQATEIMTFVIDKNSIPATPLLTFWEELLGNPDMNTVITDIIEELQITHTNVHRVYEYMAQNIITAPICWGRVVVFIEFTRIVASKMSENHWFEERSQLMGWYTLFFCKNGEIFSQAQYS